MSTERELIERLRDAIVSLSWPHERRGEIETLALEADNLLTGTAASAEGEEIVLLRLNYAALRELFDSNPSGWYSRVEKAEAERDRLAAQLAEALAATRRECAEELAALRREVGGKHGHTTTVPYYVTDEVDALLARWSTPAAPAPDQLERLDTAEGVIAILRRVGSLTPALERHIVEHYVNHALDEAQRTVRPQVEAERAAEEGAAPAPDPAVRDNRGE